jgi:sporulation protein YlmC with PRC-barrel domain
MNTGLHSHTGHKWIESDRIVDRPVYDHDGSPIGKIRCLLIDRRSGQVECVVVHSHGLFGLGSHEYELPWSVLSYDTRLPGYRASLRKAQITAADSTYVTRSANFT